MRLLSQHSFLFRKIAAQCLLAGSLACRALVFPESVSRATEPVAVEDSLRTSAHLAQWFRYAREVEHGLSAGDPRFGLELKTGGEGDSVYAKVSDRGEVIGAFLSENSSTCVEGEIVSFNIARVLGCEAQFQPAVAMTLRGKGLARFRKMLEAARFAGEKENNRLAVLRAIAPDGLRGVFKQWLPLKPLAYRSIEKPDEPPNGVLNEADPVAQFLRADAPQPTSDELVLPGLEGARAPAQKLARELANILLVDALAGQWDRFSGDNLHVFVENGVARFAALDNGGATPQNDHGYLPLFKQWVTRFDFPAETQLLALDGFLREPRGREFLGFRSEKAMAAALGFESEASWRGFVTRVHAVAAHMRELEKRGGCFFDKK